MVLRNILSICVLGCLQYVLNECCVSYGLGHGYEEGKVPCSNLVLWTPNTFESGPFGADVYTPEGPSAQYLRTLIPKAIP